MKKLFLFFLLLTFLSCTGSLKVNNFGASPPSEKKIPKFKDPDEWYFNKDLKILSDELTAKLYEVPNAEFLKVSVEDESCLEVQVTDPEQDKIGRGFMQNEVSLVVSGEKIIVTYNDDNIPNSTVSGYGYSHDNGKTFIDGGGLIPKDQMYGGGDPLILANPFDPEHFIYFQLTYGGVPSSSIVLQESFDGGKNFYRENSRSVLKGLVSPFTGKPLEKPSMFHDKEWGDWSKVNGYITLAWTFFESTKGTNYYDVVVPLAIVSKDGGKSWGSPKSLIQENWYGGLCAVASGLEGEIYVAYVEFNFNQIFLARTFDGGETWEGPFQVVGSFQSPFDKDETRKCDGFTALKGEIRITSIPSLTVDPKNGDLYLVYNYKQSKNSPDDSDIAFVMSKDKGETWTQPVKINDDPTNNDQFMPSVASAGGGNVMVMFYDRRNDPNNWNIDVYVAQSLDGGKTWLPNRKVNCKSFPPASTSCYMGDYNQIVTDGIYYYLAWGDNRNLINKKGTEEPNQDVFFAKIKAVPHIRPF